MAAPNIVTLTQENFKAEVLDSPKPVLVDFWAPWCGPCKAVSPILDELAGEYDGRVKIGKVNTDDQQTLAAEYRINSIPTLFVFQQGEIVETIHGFKGPAEMRAKLDGVLG